MVNNVGPHPITRAFRWVVISTVVLYIALVGLGVKTYTDADRVNGALCTLRQDLVKRVDDSRQFVKEHPKGFAGIPAATIKQSIEGQQRTINALHNLSC